MDQSRSSIVVQHYLDELAAADGKSEAEPVISALLGHSTRRLHLLCATLLHRSYGRLTRPPLGLVTEDLLGSVIARLIRALRETRPETVRGFFALASRHMRWELNDLARRLDQERGFVEILDHDVAAPASSESGLGPVAKRMLDAIDALPDDEREVLDLVRIHGLTHEEAAEVLGVSVKTVQRRLNRAHLILTAKLDDLRPDPNTAE